MQHKLKTINPYFTDTWEGFKNFEVRKNDRNFKKYDAVHLLEYDAENDNYSGREIRGVITYVLADFAALKEDYVVFGFTPITHIAHGEVIIKK